MIFKRTMIYIPDIPDILSTAPWEPGLRRARLLLSRVYLGLAPVGYRTYKGRSTDAVSTMFVLIGNCYFGLGHVLHI